MAIQNFLSGGYYGKLGDTVGQRWKNKRTVRAYVIPANPRTEKQQKNRGNFGQCTAKSQIALQMNYNTTLFNSTSTSAWNVRMSTARNLQKDGEQNLNLIPLYPYSYVPTYTITEIYNIKKENETFYTATVEGNLPSVDRSMSILVQTQNPLTSEVYDEFLFKADFIHGSSPHIKIYNANVDLSGYRLKARIVSNDDTAADDILVSREVEILGSKKETVYLDFNQPTVTRASNVVTVTSKTSYETATKTMTGAKITVVKAGQYVIEEPLVVDVINNNGYFAIQITTDSDIGINTAFFGADCDLSFTAFSLETNTTIYAITNNRLQITEENPTYSISGYTVDIPTDDTIQAQFHCDEGASAIGNLTDTIICEAYIATYYDDVNCNLAISSESGKTTFTAMPISKVYPAEDASCLLKFTGKTVSLLGVNYVFEPFQSEYSNKKTFVDLTDKTIFVNDGQSKVYADYSEDGSAVFNGFVSAEARLHVQGLFNDDTAEFLVNNSTNMKLSFSYNGNTYNSTSIDGANCHLYGKNVGFINFDKLNMSFNFNTAETSEGQVTINNFTLSKINESADCFIAGDDLLFPIKINPDFSFNA